MFKSKYFILSAAIHFGFFFSIIKNSSLPSPGHDLIEISLSQAPSGQEKENPEKVKVIPMSSEPTPDVQKCRNTYGGIGIEIAINTIIEVYSGYSAEKAGLQVGDVVSYTGDIRGEPGTSVLLTVLRDRQFFEITIIREKICYD